MNAASAEAIFPGHRVNHTNFPAKNPNLYLILN